MGTDINSIVQVSITRDTRYPSLPGFGRGAVIAEFATSKVTNPLLGDDRYQLYSSVNGMIDDGWLTTDLVYQAALDYFSQNPNPGTFMVGRKDSGDASWTAALAAIQDDFADWYGFTVVTNQPDDALEAAVWAQTQMKIFGYTPSQTGMYGVDSVATAGFWRTLTPGALANFQVVDDGKIGVSLDGGSVVNVLDIDFTTTAASAGFFTSGDASSNLAAFIVPVIDGEFDIDLDGAGDITVNSIDFTGDTTLEEVAATMQVSIRAADVSLNAVVVTYVTPNFVFTSDSTGVLSSVDLSVTAGAGTDLLAAGYINSGTATQGEAAQTQDTSLTEVAATLQVAIRAADVSLNAITVEYDDEFVFTSSSTGDTSLFAISTATGAGADLFGSTLLNGGNSVQGKDAVTGGTDDLGTTIKALNYDRTVLSFSSYAQDSGLAPGSIQFNWMGMIGEGFPYDPGSQTFAYKTLTGLKVEELSAGKTSVLKSNYINFLETIADIDHVSGGQNGGKVMSGEYIDIIRGTDSLVSTIQSNIFGAFTSNRKIPFTNDGGAVLKIQIFAALKLHEGYGLLDTVNPDDVVVPLVADVPAADRANRTWTGITFSARYAGAVHLVEIQGNITV